MMPYGITGLERFKALPDGPGIDSRWCHWGFFSMVPLTEPCALRSTQPLKVSTRDLSWGKGGRCVWLTTYHPCSAETSRKSGALTYPEPLGPPRPVAGDLYLYFYEQFCARNVVCVCHSGVARLQEVSCDTEIPAVQMFATLDKVKPRTQNTRDINLGKVRIRTVQMAVAVITAIAK